MKRSYKKPEVKRVVLDNSISLVMMTNNGNGGNGNGGGWGPGGKPKKPKGETFDSPFSDSPFN